MDHSSPSVEGLLAAGCLVCLVETAMVGSYIAEKQTLANLAADRALARRSPVSALICGYLPAE